MLDLNLITAGRRILNKMMKSVKTSERATGSWLALPVLLSLLLGSTVVLGETQAASQSFLRSEVAVLGSQTSASWRSVAVNPYLASGQIGGQGIEKKNEIGAPSVSEPSDEKKSGPSSTGRKVKAGIMSAIIPGVGQFYNHQNTKGYIMAGAEVAIWTCYFVFDSQGDNRLDSSIEYAGIYAGTSGSHHDSYWQSVGRYMDSDAYNEAQLREARALQEEPSNLISGSDAWQWVNEDRKYGFAKLRADANSAYDRRDFMILFAVVNRAISVVDAVLNAEAPDGKLEAKVMGMNLGFEVLPSLRNPGAQCVLSRRF